MLHHLSTAHAKLTALTAKYRFRLTMTLRGSIPLMSPLAHNAA
jgi:hypothetical protein